MITFDALRTQKRTEILNLARTHGAPNVRVFGSIIRAENHESSDIDLLVEFETGRTLLDLIGLKLDLESLLGVNVDVVTPNSLRYIRDRVLAEALPL
ncbi:MAG TPA: nucleotidyltransferase family protein [Bryobacteraceae bacterium]|nr:nucleotidyltransferase family protein [Bryobacteraceae bacterium]